MTELTSAVRYAEEPAPETLGRWGRLAELWQSLVGLAALGAMLALFFWVEGPDLAWLLALGIGTAGVVSLAAIPLIRQRNHRGRAIALAVNYLAFVILLGYTLHRLGFFIGLDSVAGAFPRGLPFMAGGLLGFLVAGLAERVPDDPRRARRFEQAGYGIMALAAGAALLAMGLLPGLFSLVNRIVASPTTLGLTGLTLLFGLATWFWWRTPTGIAFGATIGQVEMLNGYLLLSPNLLGFLLFFAGPLLFSLYVSFTDSSAFGQSEWVGLANYHEILSFDLATLSAPNQRASEVLAPRFVELTRFNLFGRHLILGAKDKLFWISLRNTFLFAFLVVPLSVLPALLLSTILNSKIPGMRFFRALYFLPSVAAVVGVAVIWNWLYNSTVGFINYGITNLVGLLNALPGPELTDPQVRWLSSSDTALLAIVLMSAWRIVGFNTVLFLAGLQGISKEIYEAADVDGAGTLRKFFSITVPLLAPTTFFVTTTTVIQALQVFDEVFVLMNPPAGPNNSTLTAVLYLYQNGFQRFNLGYASAVAWALFLVIFLVTLVQFRFQRSGEAA